MEREAFERPAALSVWPAAPAAAPLSGPTPYATLSAALRAAAEAMSGTGAQAWIVTEEGELLAPAWIRGHLH